MLVFLDGSIEGTIGGGNLENQVIKDALQVMAQGTPTLFDHKLSLDHGMGCGGEVQVFIEPIGQSYQLFVFGAGHIGATLARQAHNLGFRVTLIDERTEIMQEVKLEGVTKINKNYNDAFKELLFNKRTFITSMSHLHGYDRDIVAYCAHQPHAYLGMIGSARKIATARKFFTENNLLTNEEMDAIDWPMGLPIKCQTPDEIVISILAKLIDVRGKLMKPE